MNNYFVSFKTPYIIGNLVFESDLEIKNEEDFNKFEIEFKEKLLKEYIKKDIKCNVDTVVILNIQKLPI